MPQTQWSLNCLSNKHVSHRVRLELCPDPKSLNGVTQLAQCSLTHPMTQLVTDPVGSAQYWSNVVGFSRSDFTGSSGVRDAHCRICSTSHQNVPELATSRIDAVFMHGMKFSSTVHRVVMVPPAVTMTTFCAVD